MDSLLKIQNIEPIVINAHNNLSQKIINEVSHFIPKKIVEHIISGYMTNNNMYWIPYPFKYPSDLIPGISLTKSLRMLYHDLRIYDIEINFCKSISGKIHIVSENKLTYHNGMCGLQWTV